MAGTPILPVCARAVLPAAVSETVATFRLDDCYKNKIKFKEELNDVKGI